MTDHCRIKPFLVIREENRVYKANSLNELMLIQSVWLNEHWDELFNIQLCNIREYGQNGVFFMSNSELADTGIEYDISWINRSDFNEHGTEHDLPVRKAIEHELQIQDPQRTIILYFQEENGTTDMLYRIDLPNRN